LKVIGVGAFSTFVSRRSICIPASIEILEDRCFAKCYRLSTFPIESGSRLIKIDAQTFSDCSSLKSIRVLMTFECGLSVTEIDLYSCICRGDLF
jgi:hypothetical protein